ncbi:MerR family transcriptional regulator [Gryllotalpicola daejeonensis]|uniref:MerR family transcriptional regulator n=2 Tax=Gryllotalpicola daejeonensis TaxID=993087 RepID=A0ABP7ZJR1_9MICO
MTIGDFAQATRLSAKTLRYYHREGLLLPAVIDRSSGYRLYSAEQIADAQVVRQLRALSVPVDTVREMLRSDIAARSALIAAHLERLESELDATRAAVTALQGLLAPTPADLAVEHRSVPETRVLAIRETIELAQLGDWYRGAQRELDAAARAPGVEPSGPRGGIWDAKLFLDERGEAVLFFPVASSTGVRSPTDRARLEVVPAVDLAVVVHRGPDATMAQTYGRLGAYVAQHELGIDGPVRETYLVDGADEITEVGWPIFRTTR